MTGSTATLIAAVIAALSSFAGLFARRASELRKAHRETLEPHVQDLAEGIHQAVATSNIIVMTNSEEGRENWRARGADAKEKLKDLRVQLRYSLWGLDEALKDLSQVPDWVEHAWDYPDYREEIIERGDKLGDALDHSIRKCYRKGRTPSWFERARVEYRRRRLRSYYESFKETKKEAAVSHNDST